MATVAFQSGQVVFSHGDMEVDSVLSARHSSKRTLTDHPVEDGSVISDHLISSPIEIQMELYATDTPLEGDPAPGRAIGIWRKMLEVYNAKQALDLVTDLEVYPNMVPTGHEESRDATTTHIVRWSMTFRQVRIVTFQTVRTVPKPEIEKKVPKKVKKGPVAPEREQTDALKLGRYVLGRGK